MYPIYHFVFSVVLSGFLYPILGWKLVFFWLGSFFIDIDHYWWYILKFRDLSFRKAYIYGKNDKIKEFKLHIFHTIEFLLLVFIWSLFSEFGFVIFLGLVFHNVIDMIDMLARKWWYKRALTFLGWIYSPLNSTKM